MKIRDLKKCNTIEDLEALEVGNMIVNIGMRGGGLGFNGRDVAVALDVDESDLPRNFGAGCNYLGGGVRGAIFPSTYSDRITGRKAELLDALGAACVRAYEHAENGANDETDENGETNWDAMATNAARRAGIRSAY